ncbi:MAG: hypothetical protein GXP25_01890 [Planctomycetes bacterium]|nr:hypothetical protein [Planctomycetota bacterium]
MSDSSKKDEKRAIRDGESILPALAEKEREFEDLLRKEQEKADQLRANTQKEQDEYVAREREKIVTEKEEIIQDLLSKVQPEIQEIRDSAASKAVWVRQKAEKRFEEAVAAAVQLILPGGKRQ